MPQSLPTRSVLSPRRTPKPETAAFLADSQKHLCLTHLLVDRLACYHSVRLSRRHRQSCNAPFHRPTPHTLHARIESIPKGYAIPHSMSEQRIRTMATIRALFTHSTSHRHHGPRCSSLRTVRLGLANKGFCRPALCANTPTGGPALCANGPTLVCKRLANRFVGQHAVRIGPNPTLMTSAAK